MTLVMRYSLIKWILGFCNLALVRQDKFTRSLFPVGLELDLIFDVGANTGQYGKKIRKAGYSGTIISFEPISSAYLKLLETSKSDPKWLVHKRSAIGNINGTSEIQVSSNAVIAPGASVGDFQVFGMGSLISGVYNSSFQLHLSKKAIPTRSLLPSSRFFDVFDD